MGRTAEKAEYKADLCMEKDKRIVQFVTDWSHFHFVNNCKNLAA